MNTTENKKDLDIYAKPLTLKQLEERIGKMIYIKKYGCKIIQEIVLRKNLAYSRGDKYCIKVADDAFIIFDDFEFYDVPSVDIMMKMLKSLVDTTNESHCCCNENEYQEKINTSEKLCADKYTIYFNDKVISNYLVLDEEISLDKVINIAKSNGFVNNEMTLTVILEKMLSGVIYQYGNNGPYWVKHGITDSLA